MLKEGKFGVSEAISLTTITISTKIFFTSPAVLAGRVGTSAWYMTIFSAGVALIGFAFIYLLLKRFPNRNIAEIFDISMGRIAGFVFSLAFAALFLAEASIFVREFSDVQRSYTFSETSTSLIVGTLVIATGIAAFMGLESLARISKLAAIFMLAGYAVLLALAAADYNVYNMFPILGYGLGKTVTVGLQRSSAYSEVALLGVVAASLQGTRYIKRAGVVSLVLSALMFSLGLLSELLLFSYTSAKENTAPLYALARTIKHGNFFTRLDPLFLILWCVASAITISVLFYMAVSMYCKTFRLTDRRPVIVPMLVVLYALSLAPRDFSVIVYGLIENSRKYSWTVFFGLPLAALAASVIRNKKDEASNA